MNEISPSNLPKSPFEMIGKDWMLITAGDENKYNTMTASWGGVGVLWNKNVVFAFVRPQRFTFDFLNDNEYFSCSFFKEEYRSALAFCGKYSGRDVDKAKECNLTPDFSEDVPFFSQADTVIICKKLYVQDMTEDNFVDKALLSNYSDDDYHRVFIGEIVKVLKK
ncbi:MAG: flavin reductase family protein [Ruminococcaceae bacterium]|nr:flavin reductase family protein [Oscillospiraceae bacterium]